MDFRIVEPIFRWRNDRILMYPAPPRHKASSADFIGSLPGMAWVYQAKERLSIWGGSD